MTAYSAPRIFPPQLHDKLVSNGDIPRYDHARVIERALRCICGMGWHHPTVCVGDEPIAIAASGSEYIPIRVPVFARDLLVGLILDGDTDGDTYTIEVSTTITSSPTETLTYRAIGRPATESLAGLPWTDVPLLDVAVDDAGKASAHQDTRLQLKNTGSGTVHVYAVDLLWLHNPRLED